VHFRLWKPADVEQLEQGLRAAGIPLKASKEAWKTTAPRKWRGYLLGVWQRRQKSHSQLRELYSSKLIIAQDMLQQWVEVHPEWKLPVTFDNWYTQPAFCRFLDQTLDLPYVGTLAGEDQVNLRTGQETLQDFAERLKQEHLEALRHGCRPIFQPVTIPYKGEQEQYYSYCNTHRLHNFGKQRLVINHRQADLSDHPTFFISNRLVWQALASPAFDATAGPLKSITKKARPKGWISINYGTLGPSNDTSPWSPWCTAYCWRPNTTRTFTHCFNVNSR